METVTGGENKEGGIFFYREEKYFNFVSITKYIRSPLL